MSARIQPKLGIIVNMFLLFFVLMLGKIMPDSQYKGSTYFTPQYNFCRQSHEAKEERGPSECPFWVSVSTKFFKISSLSTTVCFKLEVTKHERLRIILYTFLFKLEVT